MAASPAGKALDERQQPCPRHGTQQQAQPSERPMRHGQHATAARPAIGCARARARCEGSASGLSHDAAARH
eukprot:3487147-Prymnesium_polylepis.1